MSQPVTATLGAPTSGAAPITFPPASMPMPMAMPFPMPPNMPPNMPPMPIPPPSAMMPGAPPSMPFPMPPNMPFTMFPGMKPMKGPQPLNKWVNVPANNTIYVNNLNEKTSRDEIINGLREVFGQFGKVLDVVCYTKIKRCKGQAWVVMEKTEAATTAIRELQNFMFFNKPMRVSYAKSVSDATLKRDGQALPQRERPPKKKKQKRKLPVETESPKKKKKRKKKDKSKKDEEEDEDVELEDQTVNGGATSKEDQDSSKNGARQRPISRSKAPPNKTLFLQNLPDDATEDEVQRLFVNFPGFQNVNLIGNIKGIGFAMFDDTYNSANAQRSLNGFMLRSHEMSVEFAQ